ncbi:ATP-binding protein [Streptomyces enissocaesilis]|uniref:ATP-binding protein n=1 Tax=Streptomyces enissocaesilis TaxID=332589 RepID=A0ABN3XK93_9ACTN
MNKETESAVATREPDTSTGDFGFSVLFATTEHGAHTARLAAERALVPHLPPDTGTTDAARLIIAELTANAALHGRVRGRKARLDLTLDPTCLLVEVTDARGDHLPAPPPDSEAGDGEGGRGLLLVEALADGWGWRPHHPGGKTVWAVLVTRTE